VSEPVREAADTIRRHLPERYKGIPRVMSEQYSQEVNDALDALEAKAVQAETYRAALERIAECPGTSQATLYAAGIARAALSDSKEAK